MLVPIKEEIPIMKKRVISLMLCFIMLLGTLLTACSSGEEEDAIDSTTTAASETAITLNLYVVTEKGQSDYTEEEWVQVLENREKVETAFNSITKAKFKTKVELYFCTAEEYEEVVEGKLVKNDLVVAEQERVEKALKAYIKEQKKGGVEEADAIMAYFEKNPDDFEYYVPETTEPPEDAETTKAETVVVTSPEGAVIYELKYPEETETQMDIIYMSGYDDYLRFIENEWLHRLDDELSGSSKKLKDYIPESILGAYKTFGSGTYAVPNVTTYGTYTYVLVNKELATKYNYKASDMSYIADTGRLDSFLSDVVKYESGVLPIYGTLPIVNMNFWNMSADENGVICAGSSNKFSILGGVSAFSMNLFGGNKGDTPETSSVPFGTVSLANSGYSNQLKKIQEYKDLGYVSESLAEGQKFAVKVVQGTPADIQQYLDEYDVNTIATPLAGNDEVFANMFAVTTYTKSLSRSMEIITYMNTNPALRNILQYGIEGENYVLNDDGTVKYLNDLYMMDIEKTGNCFTAYPTEGMDPDIWNYGMQHNQGMKLSAIIGFYVNADSVEALDKEMIQRLNKLSEEYEAKLAAVTNSAELKALLDEANTLKNTNDDVKAYANYQNEATLYYVYNEWVTPFIPTGEE